MASQKTTGGSSFDLAARQVAFGLITRQLHPELKQPVEKLLSEGFGVVKFDACSTTLVREGWFGDKRVTVARKPTGGVHISR